MRRAIAIPLYVLAGLMLVFVQLYVGMAFYAGEPVAMRVFALPLLLFALIPLLVALALETGNRLRASGLVLMAAAGVGAAITLVLMMTVGNPDMQASFEPSQRMKLSGYGLLLSLPMGAGGWFLRRAGKRKARPSALSRMAERLQAER